MIPSSKRRDLIDRLKYTFITTGYDEIEELIGGLREKNNFGTICEDFFQGCRVHPKGYLIPSGFFEDSSGSASLNYAMYELLGSSPDNFLLKHRVTSVRMIRQNLSGRFRLPRGVFLLPRLEVLIIRGIGISKLTQDILKTPGLKVLDISGNRFTEIPDAVLMLPRLRALNLSYNLLTHVPLVLNRLKRLQILSLKGNSIARLPNIWDRFPSLKTLDVSMNQIESLPNSLQSIEEVHLSYNNLPVSTEAEWETRETEKNTEGSQSVGS